MFNVKIAKRLINELKDILTQFCVQEELEEMRKYDHSAHHVDLTLDSEFTMLGAGHFSHAVEHPDLPGYVIKVGLKKEDSGAAYAAFCRNQPNKFYPQILHIESNRDAYFLVMPKYESIEGYHNIAIIKKCFDTWCDDDYLREKAHPALHSHAELVDHLYGEGFFEAARAIVAFFKDIASLDMHDENVMYDPVNKHLVFTDPVSFTRP